ncbi:tetratricopeptide repeat protein [Candidatus Margulisiibacteriota bacterium]
MKKNLGIFSITSGTKKIIAVMVSIALISIMAGWLYYHNINMAEDPRILEAKKTFRDFSQYFKSKDYDQALNVLNKIEKVYLSVPGYKDSFEIGVVNNNRAAVYLVQLERALMSTDNVLVEQRPVFLKLAKRYSLASKESYLSWLNRISGLEDEQIRAYVVPYFRPDDPAFDSHNRNKLLAKRVKDIKLSQAETKRRLSVVYTNLGILERYQNNPKQAEDYYQKAIDLWPENYIANNNLDVLKGRPLKKRSIIRQLFPPEK